MTIAELTLFPRVILAARSRREHEERDAKREKAPPTKLAAFFRIGGKTHEFYPCRRRTSYDTGSGQSAYQKLGSAP
ncbi:hypothetical protein NUKP86_46520 [Klebsiella variicola]|nr:hypothetical protein NUKP86_46520 [Klebsiella variicola]